MGKAIDLTGQTFGRWYVLGRDWARKGDKAYWLCKCLCGNPEIRSVAGSALRRGESQSCGCLAREKSSQRNKIDLLNQTFGKLTVEALDENRRSSNGGFRWWVRCKCGNPELKSVDGGELRKGDIQSCGQCAFYETINKKFNRLTAIGVADEKAANGETVFLCLCDCGNPEIKKVPGGALRGGYIKSCGKCQQFELIGQKFTCLTVLRVNDTYKQENGLTNAMTYYDVECDCEDHTVFTVCGTSLTSGKTKSCGCYKRRFWADVYGEDLTGKTFGFLKVLYSTDKRESGSIVWHCICLRDGNECDVSARHLKQGHTKSCGCCNSLGEANIQAFLQENNIQFEKEKSYDDLRGKRNNKYRYDFYLPEYNRLIEFDGEQHYRYSGIGWSTQEKFEETQQADKIKNEYALLHNIELIRIPYWERDNITLEMLLGDKYLITSIEDVGEEEIIF